jgi:hypothetical protein
LESFICLVIKKLHGSGKTDPQHYVIQLLQHRLQKYFKIGKSPELFLLFTLGDQKYPGLVPKQEKVSGVGCPQRQAKKKTSLETVLNLFKSFTGLNLKSSLLKEMIVDLTGPKR